MKHNLKYVISLVFMLLLTQSTWADPTVTIIKQLNGAVVTETSPGVVTSEIANGKCTLTVTPASGYYVTKDFITVYSVVTGGVAQTPRRTNPNLDNDPIEVSDKGENTDPTGVTTYEFTMPADGSDAEVTVDFQSIVTYDLYIGTTQVTELNAGDVFKDGKVSFTPAGDDSDYNTLTLNGAVLTNGIVWSGSDDLSITIKGTSNSITTTSGSCIAYSGVGAEVPSIRFERGSDDDCTLTLSCATGTDVITGFSDSDTPYISESGFFWLPTTDSNKAISSATITSSPFSGGDGESASTAYLISTPQNLMNLSTLCNAGKLNSKFYKLTTDIDCENLTGFEPIGTGEHPFVGTFNGSKGDNGEKYKISNLTYEAGDEDDYAGLFCKIGDDNNPGSVSNLILENCTFQNGVLQNGAIAGLLSNGTIENCTVTSCNILSNNPWPSSGGIVGGLYGGSISNCIVNGSTITATSVTNSSAGGIVGFITGSATVSGCQVTGTDQKPTTITSSVNGDDTGNNCAGGIVGNCNDGVISISNNKVLGKTTISSVDYNGDDHTWAGAIIGDKASVTLAGNTYEYTVTTSTKNGEAAAVVKEGYEQRGIGGTVYNEQTEEVEAAPDVTDNNGAVMYTKKLTVSGLGEHCGFEGIESYVPLTNYENKIFYLAPNQKTKVYLYPDENYVPSVTLTYTAQGETEPTNTSLVKDAEAEGYEYSFTMPDADAALNVTFTETYNLWIGDTQVTELNAAHILGENNTTVTFTSVYDDQTEITTNTLTLNGAALTVPVIVGLDNLTIDIKGENTITTTGASLQKMDNTNPSLTFKSNGDVVGSLTLTNTNTESLDGVLSSTFENITISRELAPIMLRYGKYTSNTYYLTAGEVHNTQFVPSLGVQVGEIQVYAGNAANVLYDAETPTAVYDVENHKLTLNGARISGAVSTSLENLTIELVGNNSIYQGGSYATLQSMYGEAVTMTIQSTGATPGTLTMNQPYTQAGTFADAHVTLDITSPLTVLSGSLTGNKDNENTVVIGAYTVAFAGTNSWATYYSPVDLAVPEDKGLTAYPVSSVNETTGVVTVPEQGLSYIPANTGVLLKRTDTTVSDYAFTAYTGQTTSIISILQGTSKATSVGGILEGYTDGSTVYVLYNDAFVKTTSGTIPANRGFLVFGDELNAPRLTIEIEGDVTGINTVQGSEVMDNDYYDLSGRKLSGKPTKSGLYIKNGTKVLVK